MSGGEESRFGFLGAGKMATALAKGWLAAGLARTEHVYASDPLPQARDDFSRETGATSTADNREVVEACDFLVLAVKPQSMKSLFDDIRPALSERHFVVSVAAGISLDCMVQGLGGKARLARVMPNTPCLVGASASAYCLGPRMTREDAQLLDRLLNTVGRAFCLPENLLDAVTGLSGSGPAFVFTIIEALSDGGVRMGLPRNVAAVLAAQTVFGSAKMILETGMHPAVLKDMVTSPGGTTMAGLHALEEGALRATLMDAVEMATRRATELGKASK